MAGTVLDLLPALDSHGIELGLQPYSQTQLARFNAYAPLVRNLKSGADPDGRPPSWSILLAKVPTRPLLPNLRVLAIHSLDSEQDSPKIVRYVEELLCPTLSDISMGRDLCGLSINPAQATQLLEKMARICPNLTKLCMHAEESHYLDDLHSLGTYSKVNPFSLITRFIDLQVLSTNSMVLDPDVLQSLGRLPRLESLKVDSYMDFDDTFIANLELPIDSFPSLRHLEMKSVLGTVLSKLWRITPLVRNLVSVAVDFRDDSTRSINRLVCDICQGSPHITDLELDLGDVGHDVTLSTTVGDHFRSLPLQRIRITFGYYADCQHLISALPNVEYLDMDYLIVYHQDLVQISRTMSKLQYLSATLALEEWPSKLPRNSSSPSSCHIDSQFNFKGEVRVRQSKLNSYLDRVARNLHSLWPRGVRCGFYSSGYDEGKVPAHLERVNEKIRALSGTSALHIPSAEESRLKWLYASW